MCLIAVGSRRECLAHIRIDCWIYKINGIPPTTKGVGFLPTTIMKTIEIIDLIEPQVIEYASANEVIAIRPLVRRIVRDAPPDLRLNRAIISRLVKHILTDNGYVMHDESSPNGVWMQRVAEVVG